MSSSTMASNSVTAPTENNGKGRMWQLDQTLDQPVPEGATVANAGQKAHSLAVTLRLAFLSLGVVYGDLATSPLYVFQSIFPRGVDDRSDIVGAVSLIVYTITLIPLIKYVFIVLRANDNGEGGTFALYSLICRHAKVNTIPNQHPTDQQLTTYSRRPVPEKSRAATIKSALERSEVLQKLLLILVLLGTSMVIGDGVLTPAISVLSSVSGIKVAHSQFSQVHVVILALVILVILFSMQHFGTSKVGFMFAPVILLWLLSIGIVGVYNICMHHPSVLRAFSPSWFVWFLRRTKTHGWGRLGGVVLSITGAEAMFADLGHFSTTSIRLAFTVLVFPCLLAAYLGQASYLMEYPENVHNTFYNSIPDPVFWPMFVIATVAAIVASQATISATFSIIKQSVALGCFPRVKVIHTSRQIVGQIYVPEVNWILMVFCLAITAGFRETTQIGNAYGIAVIAVMMVTTLLMTLIMLFIWQSNLILVLAFLIIFGSVELVYFSSVLLKVQRGGWVPLVIAATLLVVFYCWHYGTVKKYQFDMQNKVPVGWIIGLGPGLGLVRVPGIGLVYSELAHGVPPIFSHFLTHLPAIHSVVIFVCVKYLPVNRVTEDERFLFRRIGPPEYWMYRCVVRYGYRDLHKRDDDFENLLIRTLARYIRSESIQESLRSDSLRGDGGDDEHVISQLTAGQERGSTDQVSVSEPEEYELVERRNLFVSEQGLQYREVEDQVRFLMDARETGIVHIMGNTKVKAMKGSNFAKRLAINQVYTFLSKICRDSSMIFHIPHETLLNVGMVYCV